MSKVFIVNSGRSGAGFNKSILKREHRVGGDGRSYKRWLAITLWNLVHCSLGELNL